jgi:hypothetical protein
MNLVFLTPLGGLVAIGVLLPLAAFAYVELRARRARKQLALAPPPLRSTALLGTSLALVPALLGVAAAQPAIEHVRKISARTDAEVYLILDTSRSMLARPSANAPTRFDRARTEAEKVRRALSDVPVGLASLTNRLLPHLFPTSDESTFTTTLDQALGVERPPPDRSDVAEITTFDPLAVLQRQNFYSARARHRVAVVFTDGETPSLPPPSVFAELRVAPPVHLVFVHVARPGERVYDANAIPEAAYRSDPKSGVKLAQIASDAGGKAYSEDDLGKVEAAVKQAVGRGPDVTVATRRRAVALAPWAVLASLVPLAFVLGRRNVF